MTTLKYLVVTFSLIVCAACWASARAQMPALDVAIDSDQVRFVAEAQELRVEVYAPSGEMIFDSGAVTGQPVDWRMQNAKGERVADGVYLVTISMKTASGQLRKRIEQVVVGREQQEGKKPSSPNSISATITGTGTTGKIAKFTNATVIGNSVMTESGGKIGIGITTPIAFFHVKEAGSDTAILGNNTGSGIGVHGLSVDSDGVRGKSTHANGVYGTSASPDPLTAAVFGLSTAAGGRGVLGESNGGSTAYGVWGMSTKGTGVEGSSSENGTGVEGVSNTGTGVRGRSSNGGIGVDASSTNGGTAVRATGGSYGVLATGDVYGVNATGHFGVYGITNDTSQGWAIVGLSPLPSGGNNTSQAGHFAGPVFVDDDLTVTGNLSKSGGSFKIDHPLDPAHKYLYHSFVESPDMMNIYNGNITTNENGEAVVTLPAYFQALNRDFRYQLTVIGGEFAQAIISSKIAGNRFTIKTDRPNVEVSWQVTGIRKDAWAEAHRIPVEEKKPEKERGSYLHPELFNQPEEKGREWALYPEAMKSIKEKRAELGQPPAKQ